MDKLNIDDFADIRPMIEKEELQKLLDEVDSIPDDLFKRPDNSDYDPTEFPQVLRFQIGEKFPEQIGKILCSIRQTEVVYLELVDTFETESEKKAFVSEVREVISKRQHIKFYHYNFEQVLFTRAVQRSKGESAEKFYSRYYSLADGAYLYLDFMEVAIAIHHNPHWVQPLNEAILFQQSYDHIYQNGHLHLRQWITRKKDELRDLLAIINTVNSESEELTSRFLKPISSIGDQHYQLPPSLKTEKYSGSKPFFKRLPFNGTFSELLLTYEEPLHYIAQFVSDDELLAFIYNSFDFKENLTELCFQELRLGSKKKSLFRHYYHLLNSKHGIERDLLANILILNFSSFRTKKMRVLLENTTEKKKIYNGIKINVASNIKTLDKKTLEEQNRKIGIESLKG